MFFTTVLRSQTSSINHVKTVWERMSKNGFNGLFTLDIITSDSKSGTITARFLVDKNHANMYETLHGGSIASLVDIAGSLAIASKKTTDYTGVSTDLSVSYVKGVKLGETVTIISKMQSNGKTLAYTTTEFLNDDNEVVAFGSHTKFIKKR
ncbi:hypothetical protein HK099_003203 [Clydaea vesicula]|uniref:Thioesterase domain-containing protein n=1 Tax=Clydaea vesicula TaxID=447962 RepID=A0AAD5U4P4_9FUNG|nr:hypothetical protein HK099_003203 [Clydaea vesicula]KAJ3390085.1 hypothetical protein HDU92_000677 [Lobulomyces angularis]